MSKIKKLSESVKSAIIEANQEVKSLNSKINNLNDEKRRYLTAPVARDVVMKLISGNISRIADKFENKDVKGYVHDCAVYEARSERNIGVIMPSLNDLFVKGMIGNPVSWGLQPEALIWLLRDVMSERLQESIKDMVWPQQFDDGCDEEERKAKIIEIDNKLIELNEQKKLLLDEIENAGGRLIG